MNYCWLFKRESNKRTLYLWGAQEDFENMKEMETEREWKKEHDVETLFSPAKVNPETRQAYKQ